MIYLRLFWAFFQIGLFSFGGSYAAVPLIQSQIVEANKWLEMSQFADLITIAEMTPGPIAVNSATFVGQQAAGLSLLLLALFNASLFEVQLKDFRVVEAMLFCGCLFLIRKFKIGPHSYYFWLRNCGDGDLCSHGASRVEGK